MSTAAANDQTIVRAELSYELEKLTVTVGDEIIVIPNVPAAMFDAQNDEEYNLLDTAVTRAQRKGWANIYTHSVDKLRDIAERERLAMEAEGLSREATAVMSAPVVPQVVAPQPAPVVAPQPAPAPVAPVVAQPQQQTRRRKKPKATESVNQEALDAARVEKDLLGNYIVVFNYDIPVNVANSFSINVPRILRLHGAVRDGGSAYAIPAGRIPVNLIAALRTYASKFNMRKQDPSETPSFQVEAKLIADEALRNLATDLITSIGKASDECQAALDNLEECERTEKGMDKVRRECLKKCRSMITESQEEIQKAIACAEAFDLSEDVKDSLRGVQNAVRAFKKAAKASKSLAAMADSAQKFAQE